MRKIILILPVFLLLAARSFAQTYVELIPQVGYSFPARNDFYNVYGRVAGGLNLGGAINFNVNRSFGFEVLYNHVSSSSGLYDYGYDGGSKLIGGNLNQDYIMGGFVFSGTVFQPMSCELVCDGRLNCSVQLGVLNTDVF